VIPTTEIIGNAIGTIEVTHRASSLNRVIHKIISNAKNKIINEPTTAKKFTHCQ
tara:strand:- start:164 stop:325 length:162 start_codon:yes stop_codon:yes gene_type:complete